MTEYSKTIQIRWSDLDPNFHVLHSKYYDFGAFCRMSFLVENGFTPALMQEKKVGLILFREECTYRKELGYADVVRINLAVSGGREDFSRWSMKHEIYKNGDILAAVIMVDGAWLDTEKRKLAAPIKEMKAVFIHAPKTNDFHFQQKAS